MRKTILWLFFQVGGSCSWSWTLTEIDFIWIFSSWGLRRQLILLVIYPGHSFIKNVPLVWRPPSNTNMGERGLTSLERDMRAREDLPWRGESWGSLAEQLTVQTLEPDLWVRISVLLLISCATLGKLLNLSVPWFSLCRWEYEQYSHPRIDVRLKQINIFKCIERYLAHIQLYLFVY